MSLARDAALNRGGDRHRHRFLVVILWLQIPMLVLIGLILGEPLYTIAMTSLALAALALLAMAFRTMRLAEAAVSFGLVAAASVVVDYAGGAMFAHFGFFLAVTAISLYRDWFALAIGAAAVSGWHLLVAPGETLTHAGAILALVFLLVVGWRLTGGESARDDADDRFRIAFDTAPIGMAVLRPSGELIEVNAQMAQILGYDATSLAGTNITALIHPDDHDDLGLAWERMGNNARDSASHWMRCLTGTGRPIWGRVSLCLVPRAKGVPASVVLQLEDVDHDHEEQRRLQMLLRGKDEFVAALGEEIRRPLGDLIDLTAVADHPHVDTSQTLPRIGTHAREIASILDDLVVSARADVTPISVMGHRFDAATLCRELIDAIPDGKSVEMRCEAHQIWADRSLTKQIVGGLLNNAIRYGGPNVSLRTVRSGPDTVIQVIDDGPEIPMADRERVFRSDLRSGSPVTQPAAVGLSLTVGRHLARLMDGDMSYHRSLDGGNVFELRLPTEQISQTPRLSERSREMGIPA